MGSMFSAPDAPTPINPAKAGNQALNMNKKNAFLQASFNRLDQQDQFGNILDYKRTGTDGHGNPIYKIHQKLGETGQKFAGGLSALGQRYFEGANNLLDNPADYTNAGVEDRIYQLGARRLDPRFQAEQSGLETQLANMGLARGSEAWNREMERFGQMKNDAYNQLALTGRSQAFNEALQGRGAQIAELQGLTAPGLQFGTSTTSPHLINAPQINGGNVDLMGYHALNAQQQAAAYQAQMAQQQGMMGGLGSIGGALLAAPMTGGGSVAGNIMGKFI